MTVSPFLLRAADRLYQECERAIREGRIDARSPIGDATLDYREIRNEPLYRDADDLCTGCGVAPGQTHWDNCPHHPPFSQPVYRGGGR